MTYVSAALFGFFAGALLFGIWLTVTHRDSGLLAFLPALCLGLVWAANHAIDARFAEGGETP